jgi:hypothetical protein
MNIATKPGELVHPGFLYLYKYFSESKMNISVLQRKNMKILYCFSENKVLYF